MTNFKFKLIVSLIIMACITLTGCEKDNVLAPSPKKEPMAKNKSINNKSGEVPVPSFEVLKAYADEFSYGTNPETLPWNAALLYIEASINMNEANGEKPGVVIMETVDLSVSVTLTSDSISGTEANSIYSLVVGKIDSVIDAYENEGEVKLYMVDFKLEGLDFTPGSNEVVDIGVVTQVPSPYTPPPINCNYTDNYRAMNNNGKCTAPHGYSDAVQQLEAKLNSSTCNSQLDAICTPWNPKQVTVEGWNNSYLWSGNSDLDCITSFRLNTLENNIKSLMATNQPNGYSPPYLTNSVDVYGGYRTGGTYFHGINIKYTQSICP